MGGSFAGGLALGLTNALQKGQEQATQESYKKALIEQSKLQTKQLENKLNIAQYEQQMWGSIAKQGGLEVPPMPQPVPVQQAKEQPQQGGLGGILGRLIHGGQPQPQVQQVSAPQSLPQMIAQGQAPPGMAQEQIDPTKQAFAKDLFLKKFADMPPWRERLQEENKNIGRAVTTMGPNGPMTVLLDKTGKPMGAMPTVPEFGSIKSKGMQGEEYEQFYPKTSPPGFGGRMGGGRGGVMTQPPPQMMAKEMPEGVREKVTKLEVFGRQLQSLKEMASPEVFGLLANAKAKAADTPLGAVMPANPQVLAFHKIMKDIENKKVHEFGGSNLTAQELQRALASLPRAYNAQDFHTAVDALIGATNADVQDYYKSYSQSEAMKGVQGGGLGPKPQVGIPQGYQYYGTKNGKPLYVNPNASPDKKYWSP